MMFTLHAKSVTKVVAGMSTPSHHSNLLGYDRHVLPFIDVEGEECVEHVSDKEDEEEMEDNRRSYGASIHGVTLNVLISLWMSNFMLYFLLCPKNLQLLNFLQCLHQFPFQIYMISIKKNLEHAQYLEYACIFLNEC